MFEWLKRMRLDSRPPIRELAFPEIRDWPLGMPAASLAWGPGDLLAAAWHESVLVFEVTSGRLIFRAGAAHDALAWRGSELVFADSAGLVFVDPTTGRRRARPLTGGEEVVFEIAITRGRAVYTTAPFHWEMPRPGGVVLDLADAEGTPIPCFPEQTVWTFGLSADGALLAYEDEDERICVVRPGTEPSKPLLAREGGFHDLALSPDGKRLAVITEEDRELLVLQIGTGAVDVIRVEAPVALHWHPSGSALLVGVAAAGELIQVDVETGKLSRPFDIGTHKVGSIAVDAACHRLAVSSSRSILLFELV